MNKALILMLAFFAASVFQVSAHGTVSASYIDAVGNTVYVDTGGGIKASTAQINLEKKGNAMDVVGKAALSDLTVGNAFNQPNGKISFKNFPVTVPIANVDSRMSRTWSSG